MSAGARPGPGPGGLAAAALRRPPWFALAVCLLLAATLVVRLAYVDATPDYVVRHDARDYDQHARSIALGEGYAKTVAYGRPTAFRPPGYPYFLAGVYRLAGVEGRPTRDRVHAARVAYAFTGTAVVALLGLLAGRLWGRRMCLIALALGAVYVPLIVVGGAVMSEPLFDLLMLAAVIAAVEHRRSPHRYRLAVLAGILAGLAVLTRANAVILLIPLALAVWDGRPRRAWRSLAVPAALLAAAVLTIAPWTVRNAVVMDSFVPVSTQLGSSLAGTYNDVARNDPVNPGAWRSIRHVPAYAPVWHRVRTTPEPVLERELRATALHYAADHPLYVLEVGYWNTRRMLDLAGVRRSRATAATISIDHRWADASRVCFWIFAALAAAGATTGLVRRAPAWLWAVPAVLFLSVVFLAVETPRYRTPIDPFIVLLAAAAVATLWARARPSA